MSTPEAANKSPALAQAVAAPLTRAAIFLVATLNPGSENRATLRSFCGDLAALVRAVEFRDLEGGLSVRRGVWVRRMGSPLRAAATGGTASRSARFAPERATRFPLPATCCSTSAPSAWIYPSNWPRRLWRVSGMLFPRSMKCRASVTSTIAISWVSSTERRIPRGAAAADAVVVGDEDANFAGGSYVIVQKYLHDLDAWNALSTEAQERIIGRTKLSDIELDDSVKPTSAHSALTTIVENGKEIKILRDNMPFGRPGTVNLAPISSATAVRPAPSSRCSRTCSSAGRPATTTGYSTSAALSPETCSSCPRRRFWRTWRRSNERRSAGKRPPVNRLPQTSPVSSSSIPSVRDGSLGIGSLKGDTRHE